MKERLLGRPRRRWKDIKMDHKDTASHSVDWIIWLRIGSSDELL
jgi:hypothetical protein